MPGPRPLGQPDAASVKAPRSGFFEGPGLDNRLATKLGLTEELVEHFLYLLMLKSVSKVIKFPDYSGAFRHY